MLLSAAASAQSITPKLEAHGQLVKATYYNAGGLIQQQGFFKDGKPDGQWVSFDEKGNKKAMGEYANGEKTGKWVFWNDATLSEVEYSDSRVASVKNWKQEALVIRN